jgi:small subunit ribosomal protein S13
VWFLDYTMTQQTHKTKYIVRIADTDLDGNKQVFMALQKIKGVGDAMSHAVCVVAQVPKQLKLGDLDDATVAKLNAVLKNPEKIPSWMYNRQKDEETGENNHLTGGDLVFAVDMGIKRLKMIKCYRGMRHAFGLPARGQRTRSNHRKTKSRKAAASKVRPKKTTGAPAPASK